MQLWRMNRFVSFRNWTLSKAPQKIAALRFYRVGESRSTENLGLGLAIGKATVTAHGGTIAVARVEKKNDVHCPLPV